MTNFDWQSPESIDHTRRSLEIITIIDEMDNLLNSDVDLFAEPGCQLHQLSMEFEKAPISLSHSLRAALTTSRGALDQISLLIREGHSTYRIALLALTRSALLSAGRVIYVLGPADAAARTENAHMVLRQEGHSLLRGLRAFDKFEVLAGLKPPLSFISEMQDRNEKIQEGGGRRDDTLVLSEMAGVISKALTANQENLEEDEVVAFAEHVTWVWQTYSGEAHGFGWPGYLPGDFVADLGMVVGVVQHAFDMAIKATRAGSR